jgi:enoyl-CoA hydratase/carnithine racemase
MELLERLPDLQTLDVRVERRIARVTTDNKPINLMDATVLEELDQFVRPLAQQGDSVRVVIFQSALL